MLYGYLTVYLASSVPLLEQRTGQCPVVCLSHLDNDGTVVRGVSTCPVAFLDQPLNKP